MTKQLLIKTCILGFTQLGAHCTVPVAVVSCAGWARWYGGAVRSRARHQQQRTPSHPTGS